LIFFSSEVILVGTLDYLVENWRYIFQSSELELTIRQESQTDLGQAPLPDCISDNCLL